MGESDAGEIANEDVTGAGAVLGQLQHGGHIETFELKRRVVLVQVRV